MAEDRFQELKEKYVSVLNVLNHEHIHVEKMHLQDNKLFIRGVAPNDNAKSHLWDAIKSVNPKFAEEVQADIRVEAQQASQPAQHAPTVPAGGIASAQQQNPSTTPVGGQAASPQKAGEQTYTVQRGDTLSAISKRFYGNSNEYNRIFEANRDQLKDPDKIFPGQVLKIPADNKA